MFAPIQWPEQWELPTIFSGRLSTPVFRRELLKVTCMPSDLPSGWVEQNSGAGAIHSSWNSSLVTMFSAAAYSSFSNSSWFLAWPPMGAHGKWCQACSELLRPPSISDPLSELCFCCKGWQYPHSTVHVTQSDGRQVNIKHPCERPVVSPEVSNHKKSWLPDSYLNLAREGSRSEAASNGSGSSSIRKLQHSLLTSIPGWYDTGISWISNVNNGMSFQQKHLLRSL